MICDALYRTGVLALMNEGGYTEIEQQYVKLIHEQKANYQKGWETFQVMLEML